MQNLRKLFAILHKWKAHYLLASLLLILSTFARILEPKILQIAIDGIIVFFQSNGTAIPNSDDSVAQMLYAILPDLTLANLTWILVCIGLLYLGISLIRGLTMFISKTITAYSTEKAIKRLRDNLFAHIQYLPLSFHSKLKTCNARKRHLAILLEEAVKQ